MKKPRWYYSAQSHNFNGFVCLFYGDPVPAGYTGPFETFSEAKRDAVAFFESDIREAKRCIEEIKKCQREAYK